MPVGLNLTSADGFYEIKNKVTSWVNEAKKYLLARVEGRDDRVETEAYGFQLRVRAISTTVDDNHVWKAGSHYLSQMYGHNNPIRARKINSHNPPQIQLEYKHKYQSAYTPISVDSLIEWMYKTRGS